MSTTQNWTNGPPSASNAPIFPAATAGVITQDIDALTVPSILFNGTGPGPYTLQPGSQTTTTVTIGAGGIITTADLARATLAFPITLGAAQTWSLMSAITVSGDLDNGGTLLTVTSNDATGPTRLTGIVKGAGGLTLNGTGAVALGGTAANTYSGNTTVNGGGTLTLDKPDGVVGIPGNVTISSSTLVYAHDDQIANTARVNVYGTDALFKLDGHKDTIGMLDPSGTVDLGAGGVLTLAGSQDMTLGGKILGDAASKIVFNGSASQFLTMSLNGTGWTGTLVVGAGTLQSAQNAAFHIDLGRNGASTRAILSGTFGAITVNSNATIVPGTFSVPGIVSSGSLSISTGGTYQARLGGPTPGAWGRIASTSRGRSRSAGRSRWRRRKRRRWATSSRSSRTTGATPSWGRSTGWRRGRSFLSAVFPAATGRSATRAARGTMSR
jgi:autotransporter-associated beta strand protein